MSKTSNTNPLTDIVVDDNSEYKPLSDAQVASLLEEHGKNVCVQRQKTSWPKILFRATFHPFTLILLVLAIISIVTEDYPSAVTMSVMVIVSTTIKFVQEYKSEVAADALMALIENDAKVIRVDASGQESERVIAIEDVVPGDIVKLAAGDMIPGDIMLLESTDLFISQAALTGESLPVMKNADVKKKLRAKGKEEGVQNPLDDNEGQDEGEIKVKEEKKKKLEQPNLCFMGTSVVSGTARAVVQSTGSDTLYASISKTLVAKRGKTAFEKGLLRVSYMFIGLMLGTLPIVFCIVGFIQGDWLKALTFAVSIAVGLTPELLPAIVNTNLSLGALEMSKKKTIVKRIDSIMNFGAMDVLCTDKTGTLTKDKVSLVRNVDPYGKESLLALRMAFLNANLQNGLRNLLDIAIDDHYNEKVGEGVFDGPDVFMNKYIVLDEIPFDFKRRRVSVILREKETNDVFLTIKGAVKEVLAICTRIISEDKEESFELTDERKKELFEMMNGLNSDGLRVLAVGRRSLDNNQNEFSEDDECNLEFLGFIAFLDPPKISTIDAIKKLHASGIDVKVLTGDSPLVCAKVCREIGINPTTIYCSEDVAEADDKKLMRMVQDANIFAKLEPVQKSRVIEALQANGHVVGFLGDGINDAPALRKADVGISVDGGTAIAKETADIILLEKDLTVLAQGVMEGRKTYGNSMKYLKLAVSGNFGNIFSVIIATAWLPFLPMEPTHIVIQSLLYEVGQIAIPWDNVDKEILEKPRVWSVREILRFMAFLGPVSTVFDVITFAFLLYFTHWNKPEHAPLFHSAWFLVGIFTQQIILFVLRTEKVPFLRRFASWQMYVASIAVIGLSLIFPLTPINKMIQMEIPTLEFWIFLPVTVVCYCLFSEIVKVLYIWAFKSWI